MALIGDELLPPITALLRIKHEGRKYLVGYHPAVRFYREDLGEKVKEDFTRLKRELKKL